MSNFLAKIEYIKETCIIKKHSSDLQGKSSDKSPMP